MARKIRYFDPPLALTLYERLRQPHLISTPTVTVPITDELREHFRCSICFEILSETRMAPCSHRFCKECINPWVGATVPPKEGYQLAKNCPKCRMSIPTTRHLKADKTTDAFIALLFPNGENATTNNEEMPRAASIADNNQAPASSARTAFAFNHMNVPFAASSGTTGPRTNSYVINRAAAEQKRANTPGTSRLNQRKSKQTKKGHRLGVIGALKLVHSDSDVQYQADHDGRVDTNEVEPPIVSSPQEEFNIQDDQEGDGRFNSEIYLSSSVSATEEEGPINIPRDDFNSTPRPSELPTSSPPLTTTIEPVLDSPTELVEGNDDEFKSNAERCNEEFNVQSNHDGDVQLIGQSNSGFPYSSSESDSQEEEDLINVARDSRVYRRSNRLKFAPFTTYACSATTQFKERSRRRSTVSRQRHNSVNTTTIPNFTCNFTSQLLARKLAQAITEDAINNQPQKETQEERDLVENSDENKSIDEHNENDFDSDVLGDYENYLDSESESDPAQNKIPRVASNAGDILAQIDNLQNTEKSETVNGSVYQKELLSNEPETQSKDPRPENGAYRIPKRSCPPPVTPSPPPPPTTNNTANSHQIPRRPAATEQQPKSPFQSQASRQSKRTRYDTEGHSNRPWAPPAPSRNINSRRTFQEIPTFRDRYQPPINRQSTVNRAEYYQREEPEILDCPPPRVAERRSPPPKVNQNSGAIGKVLERVISSFKPTPTAKAFQDNNRVVWKGDLSLETYNRRITIPVLASALTKNASFNLWFQDATIVRQGLHVSQLMAEALARQSICSASTFAIVHLWPSNGNCGDQFSFVFKHLISNIALQVGCVELSGLQFVHQMFIFPLAGCAPLPPFLVGRLEANFPLQNQRPDMLLGILVRRQAKANTCTNSTQLQAQQQQTYQTPSRQPSRMNPWLDAFPTRQPSLTPRFVADNMHPQFGNYQSQQNMPSARQDSFYQPYLNVPPPSSSLQSVPGVSFTTQQMPYQTQNLSTQAPWVGYSPAPVDFGSSIQSSSAFGEYPRTSYTPVQGFPLHQQPSGQLYYQQQQPPPFQQHPHHDHQMHPHL